MHFLKSKKTLIFVIFVTFYVLVNLFTLPFFPFFHSDEIWLSNQSLDIFITKSFKTTESFFDLYPRTPHGLKLLFNTIQIICGRLMGHNYITYRLISLIVALATLLVFYKTLLKRELSKVESLLWTLALGMNIQWFYMSHFARQEPFIMFIYILAYYLYTREKKLLMILVIVSGFFIHPNSYIIALIFFILFLLKKDYSSLRNQMIIGGSTTVIIVIISFLLNMNFIKDYATYGNSLGVGASLLERTVNFKDFFIKLYAQISGTYYVPDIRIYLVSLLVLLIFSFFMVRREPLIPATLWGFIIGSWIIGRYNATSIIIVIPIIYCTLALITIDLNKMNILIPLLIIILSTFPLTRDIYAYKSDYQSFINTIDQAIPNDSKVLANLNMGYAFEPGNFYDYRNLGYLNGASFKSYVEERDITYIVWTDELDYLHRNSKWQILYGDMTYYDDAKSYLEEECDLIYDFVDNAYGVRIVRYMHEPSWKIYIYKVKG